MGIQYGVFVNSAMQSLGHGEATALISVGPRAILADRSAIREEHAGCVRSQDRRKPCLGPESAAIQKQAPWYVSNQTRRCASGRKRAGRCRPAQGSKLLPHSESHQLFVY